MMKKDHLRFGVFFLVCCFIAILPADAPTNRVPCLDRSHLNLTQSDDCTDLIEDGCFSICLNFANNNLTTLPGNLATCPGCSSIMEVKINSNNFFQIPYKALAGIDCHYLVADENQIHSLEDGCRPLPRLTKISVVNNRLQTVTGNLLEVFQDLREGNFTGNNVTDVPKLTRLCQIINNVSIYLMNNPLKNFNLEYFVKNECVTRVTLDDTKMVIYSETPDNQRVFKISIFHNSKTVRCDENIVTNHLSKLEVNVTCVHSNGTSDRVVINPATSSTTSSMTSDHDEDYRLTTPTSSASSAYKCNTSKCIFVFVFVNWLLILL